LPLQSPNRVPLTGAAAPAMVMSRKSMSVSDAAAAQVSVRGAPRVNARRKVLHVASAPAESVKVPVTVKSKLSITNPLIPEDERPATVILLKVLGEYMPPFVMAVDVNDTLLKVDGLKAAKAGAFAVKVICDVPQLNVKLTAVDWVVPKFIATLPESVIVPEPNVMVLEFEFELDMIAAVTL